MSEQSLKFLNALDAYINIKIRATKIPPLANARELQKARVALQYQIEKLTDKQNG